MEKALPYIITISVIFLCIILASVLILKEDKSSKMLSGSDLKISSLTLILSILVLNINIYLLPWYINNFNPLKGYLILFTLSVVFILNLSFWFLSIKNLLAKKDSFLIKKENAPQLKTS